MPPGCNPLRIDVFRKAMHNDVDAVLRRPLAGRGESIVDHDTDFLCFRASRVQPVEDLADGSLVEQLHL
jgi:hypothetical protein